jgi:hypothetical protein
MNSYQLSAPPTKRLPRFRKLGLILAAAIALPIATAGPALATHDGVHAEVTILRGSTVVAAYEADVLNPGNETYFVHLWNVSGRDYKRIVGCWGGNSRQLTLTAGTYSRIDACPMSGQWKIQTSLNFKGAEMFPTHENDVQVKVYVNTGPQG